MLVVTERPRQTAICYRCQSARATCLIHDGRGCEYACAFCRAWRSAFPAVEGHLHCPESDEQPPEAPVAQRRRRTL